MSGLGAQGGKTRDFTPPPHSKVSAKVLGMRPGPQIDGDTTGEASEVFLVSEVPCDTRGEAGEVGTEAIARRRLLLASSDAGPTAQPDAGRSAALLEEVARRSTSLDSLEE